MIATIITFNLRLNVKSDKENNWHHRVKSVVHYIRETKPLILCTQECTDLMMDELTSLLPDYEHIGVVRKKNEEFSAIFYNKDLLSVRCYETFWLSKTPTIPESIDFDSACVRVCTYGEFYFKESYQNRFRVFNTHLDHQSPTARLEGIKIIIAKMNELSYKEKLPIVLTGDFNSLRNDEVNRFLYKTKLKSVNDSFEENVATFHNFKGNKVGEQIDYIYVSDDISILNRSIYQDKIDGIYPSDHYPLSCKIEF